MDADCPAAPAPLTKTKTATKKTAAPKKPDAPKKPAAPKASAAGSSTPQAALSATANSDGANDSAPATQKKATRRRVKEPAAPKTPTTPEKRAAAKASTATPNTLQTPSTDNMAVDHPVDATPTAKRKDTTTKRKRAAPRQTATTSSIPQTPSTDNVEVDGPSEAVPATKKKATKTKKQPPPAPKEPAPEASITTSSVPQAVPASDVEADCPGDLAPAPQEPTIKKRARRDADADPDAPQPKRARKAPAAQEPGAVSSASHKNNTGTKTRKPVAGGRKPGDSTAAVRASGPPVKDRKKAGTTHPGGDIGSTPATLSQNPQVDATHAVGNAPSTPAVTSAPDAVDPGNKKRTHPTIDSTDDDEPLAKRVKADTNRAPAPVPQNSTNADCDLAGSTGPRSAKVGNNKKARRVKKATGTRRKKAATIEVNGDIPVPDLPSLTSALSNETEGAEAISTAQEAAACRDTTVSNEIAASRSEVAPKPSNTGEVVDTSTKNPLEEDHEAHKTSREADKAAEPPETSEAPKEKSKHALAKERKAAREAAAEDITYGEYEIPAVDDDIPVEDPVTAHVSSKLTIHLRHFSGAPGAEHGTVPFSLKRLLLGSHRIHQLVAHLGAAALHDAELPLPRFITRATLTDYAIYTADRTNNLNHTDAHWSSGRALRLAVLALHMADADAADAAASTLARIVRDWPARHAATVFDAADAHAFFVHADALAQSLAHAPRNDVARRLAAGAPIRALVVDVLAAPERVRETLVGLRDDYHGGFVAAVRARCGEVEEPVLLGAEREWCAEYHFHGRYGLHERCRVLDSLEAAGGEEMGETREAVLEEMRAVEEDEGEGEREKQKEREASDEEMLADTRARTSVVCGSGSGGGRGSDDSEDGSDDEGWPKPSVVPHWLYPIRAVEFEERRKRVEEERRAAEGRS